MPPNARGDNEVGQLGRASPQLSGTPLKVEGAAARWTATTCGIGFTTATEADTWAVWVFGSNNGGQPAGAGCTAWSSMPEQRGKAEASSLQENQT